MRQVGQPLRFLGWVLGGWVVLRVGAVAIPALWSPIASPELDTRLARQEPDKRVAPSKRSASAGEQTASAASAFAAMPGIAAPERKGAAPARSPLIQPGVVSLPAEHQPLTQSDGPAPARPNHESLPAAPLQPSPLLPSASPASKTSRWSLTGWMLWRRDASASLAQGPLLGGSQGGVRLDYRLWNTGTRSLSLYGRVTRALDRPFAEEAAVGLSVRPVEGLPVALMAERRQRLGTGGRNGFAVMAAGGLGPRPIAPGVEVEGYAQAGVVASSNAVGFVDGKLGLGYRLTPRMTAPDLSLGLGLSGGAQPGASRLDFGPELRLRLPVAGGHVRLSAEWRQRLAGSARPASGPAIALVGDF